MLFYESIFRVTVPMCREFAGHQWIPLTKASDAELWCFLWSAPLIPGWVNNRKAGDLRRHRAHYDVTVMYVLSTAIDNADRKHFYDLNKIAHCISQHSVVVLTHCCLVMPYAVMGCGNTDSNNGLISLLPDGTGPIPESIRTYHRLDKHERIRRFFAKYLNI